MTGECKKDALASATVVVNSLQMNTFHKFEHEGLTSYRHCHLKYVFQIHKGKN